MPINRSTIKNFMIVAVIGIIATAVILMYADISSVWDALRGMDMTKLPLIIFLIPLNFVIKIIRFHYYLKLSGAHIRIRDESFALLAASTMVITPGKLGEMLLRGYLLKQLRYDISTLTIFAMMFADRLTEGLAMVVLSTCTILTFQGMATVGSIAVIGVCIVGVVFVLQWRSLCVRLLNFVQSHTKGRFLESICRCREAYEQSYVIFRLWSVLLSTGLGVLSWCCEAGVVFLSVQALGGSVSAAQSIFAVSFSGIVGAVSMLPGGVGVADGTLLGILLWSGIPKDLAGAVTIISRFSTMWVGVLIGVVLLIVGHDLWYVKKVSD
ncbi:lysylphosphatidylglycerol synthase transmembrane domain-containing protein [Oscillibacter valericigenes]|nr:lysylphosphatidylglycerol synthase transmembrane domain-containing protein [Oscillibacter valericigenes]